MADKTTGVSITLYQSQVDRIEKYLNQSKRYKSVASFFQHLVDNFFEKDNKVGLKNFMLYIGYPMIFAAVMLYVAITTQSVNEALLKHLIISELLIYNQIYYIIGFAFLGIIIAGFVFILSKRGKE